MPATEIRYTWTTRDRRTLFIDEMTPSHARNAAAMLERNARRYCQAQAWAAVARYCGEQECDALMDLAYGPIEAILEWLEQDGRYLALKARAAQDDPWV